MKLRYGDRIFLLFDPTNSSPSMGVDGDPLSSHRDPVTGLSGREFKYSHFGIASALGYVEKDIYVMTIPREAEMSYTDFKASLNSRGISNIRDCIWEVMPPLKYEFHKEYARLLANYEQIRIEWIRKNQGLKDGMVQAMNAKAKATNPKPDSNSAFPDEKTPLKGKEKRFNMSVDQHDSMAPLNNTGEKPNHLEFQEPLTPDKIGVLELDKTDLNGMSAREGEKEQQQNEQVIDDVVSRREVIPDHMLSLNQSELESFMENKLSELQKRVLKEQQINNANLEKLRGQPVRYGQEVCFMHSDSRSMISRIDKNSESALISSAAKLSEWPSKEISFRFLPKFKSRLLNDEILIDDEVSIQSSSEKHYLDFAPDLPHYLNDGEMRLEDNKFKTEAHVFDVRYPRYKCVLSGDRSVNWKIMGLRSKPKKANEICGLDMIRLSHTEFESFLTCGLKYKSSSAEVYLRTYYGPYESEKTCLSSVWQVVDETSVYIGDPLMIEAKYQFEFQDGSAGDIERSLAGIRHSLHAISHAKEENFETNGLKLQHFTSQKFLYSALYKQAQGKANEGEVHVCVLGKHTLKSLNAHYTAIKMQPLMTTVDRVLDNKTYVLQTSSKKTTNRLVLKPDQKVDLTRKFISKNSEGAVDTIFIPLEDADRRKRTSCAS